MSNQLPNVVVANLHKRYTGITATVHSLVPVQQEEMEIAVLDHGGLNLANQWSLTALVISGFQKPKGARFRVLHARRDFEMMLGILLRMTPGQHWRILHTIAGSFPPKLSRRILLRAMDGIVAASVNSAQYVPETDAIVNHGVDTGFFCPAETEVSPQKIIGYTGRIRPAKGVDVFVDAMIRLLPSWPEFTVEIAGLCRPKHQGFLKNMQSRIAEAGLESRIRFLGFLDRYEVREMYRRLTICVVPSLYEGFGLVPLEALACGTPVITTDVSPFWVDLIDEKIGRVVKAGDSDELEDAVSQLLRHTGLCDEMRKHSRERIVEHHSVRNEAAALNKIYCMMMQGEWPERRSFK